MAILCAAAAAMPAATIPGWILAGTGPANYAVEIDRNVSHGGRPAACLRSVVSDQTRFGTLMQSFSANRFKGKRVRFSGFVKSNQVAGWAGLWLRIDKGEATVAFDNMQGSAIRGTTDWKRYDVVLDVPEAATGIAFGILLSGTGTVWLAQASFEEVDASVAVTAAPPEVQRLAPINLDFEQQ